jgi:hypothetical protein
VKATARQGARRDRLASSAPLTHEQEKLVMKQVRIIGLMLLSLLALGAFAASTALAEEGVLPPETFSGEGGAGKLQTLNNEFIECKKVSILEGKFLTEKEKDQHGLADLHFSGCTATIFKIPVNTLGDESGIILAKVLFLICLVEPVKLVFGILILPEETVHIEVPAAGELLLVKGAVIAELEGAGLKGKEFKYKLVGKEGHQTTALKCTINGKEFKHSYESANDKEAKDEHASQEGKFTIKFTKEVTLEDA